MESREVMADLGGHPPLRRGPANATAFAWLTSAQFSRSVVSDSL